jgi:hypothetical protein
MYDFRKFAKDAESATELQRMLKQTQEAFTHAQHPELKAKLQKTIDALKKQIQEAGGDDLATDPPVSQAQRRAMFAAKAGKSNIGIPQKVGAEFAKADPGGKLPARKR